MSTRTLKWHSLNKGDLVELFDGEVIVAGGVIDDLTEDRTILWLMPSYSTGPSRLDRTCGGGRRMMHRADGWDVREPVSE